MAKAPTRFWRVTWDAALGWPYPERRREVVRNFTDAKTAGAQVARIRAMPSHLKLKSVEVSNEVEWAPFDADELPVPVEDELYEDSNN